MVPRNPPVDWWLFLAPDGVDFQALVPVVNVLFGMVVSRTPWFYGSSTELGALCLMSQLLHPEAGIDVAALARMDRVGAARLLNRHVQQMLESGPW